MTAEEQQDLSILVRLASPRGFCAGVERAIRTVEESLARYGAPVYVRHEIVHNKHVVDRLAAMGAVFVDELCDAPDDRPIILSAHGAPRSVHDEAKSRNLTAIDATCPLVLKVHAQTQRFALGGRIIIVIGHEGHPEVIGTRGQVGEEQTVLVETLEDVERLPAFDGPLAYVTQTTLSVDDTRAIIDALKMRFPHIEGPSKQDICFATSNRQDAVRTIAPGLDLFVIIGSANSSNSNRLVDTALDAGARKAQLVDDASQFDWSLLDDVSSLGLSAGASAPETLVEEFLTAMAKRHAIHVETVEVAQENVTFNSPLKRAS